MDWSSSKPMQPKQASTSSNSFANLSLKPSPHSSRATSPAGTSQQKKTGDSFSNLVPFGRDKQTSNLSLLEQQKKLEEQRRNVEEERLKKMDALFGGGGGANGQFWDSLDG